MTCSHWNKGSCWSCSLGPVHCCTNIDSENPEYIVQLVYQGKLVPTSFEHYLKVNPEVNKLAIEQAKRILGCDECRRKYEVERQQSDSL